VDPNLGKWEKHTKGIGMKLLSKMGFKGRLGAKEKGVSTVVETVVRPSNLGLGFGNFKEMAQLKNNKVFEAQLRGEDVVVDEPGAKAAQRKRRGPASLTDKLLKQQEQSWRKSEATAKAEKQRAAKADKAEKCVRERSEGASEVRERSARAKRMSEGREQAKQFRLCSFARATEVLFCMKG
jgi:tuftelin-interacting protein 11